ncbi:hypothetical protein NC652_016950 [Populus alba x Populus x berolinensis]|nr:hypothetical protein NC652_016950 [Populus alba x Populus x berolinensis]
MQTVPVNPKPFLNNLTGKTESLLQFQILLLSFVLLMECDLQQGNTEEYIDGQFTGNLGEILIRLDECYLYVTMHLKCGIYGRVFFLQSNVASFMGEGQDSVILKKKYVVGSVCKLSADAPMFSTVMEFRRIKR